jgi:hypothetical protein
MRADTHIVRVGVHIARFLEREERGIVGSAYVDISIDLTRECNTEGRVSDKNKEVYIAQRHDNRVHAPATCNTESRPRKRNTHPTSPKK